MHKRLRCLLSIALCAVSLRCHAADPRFTLVSIDTTQERLELFLKDDKERTFTSFSRLSSWLKARGKRLRFAVNAGMYHPGFAPVGLFVRDGVELAPLNLDAGKGNFFLKPNGVFLIGAAGPSVVESSVYPSVRDGVRLATQSGPLLLQGGAIHPAFQPQSSSRHIRNGVGVIGSKAIFVISDVPVTFYELAVFFRDQLHCRDALYLDGSISSLYSEQLERHDAAGELGPILGVTD